jgi:hypothetical protein
VLLLLLEPSANLVVLGRQHLTRVSYCSGMPLLCTERAELICCMHAVHIE